MALSLRDFEVVPNLFGDNLDELREKLRHEILYSPDIMKAVHAMGLRSVHESYVNMKELRNDMLEELEDWWRLVTNPDSQHLMSEKQIEKVNHLLLNSHPSIARFMEFLDKELLPVLKAKAEAHLKKTFKK